MNTHIEAFEVFRKVVESLIPLQITCPIRSHIGRDVIFTRN